MTEKEWEIKFLEALNLAAKEKVPAYFVEWVLRNHLATTDVTRTQEAMRQVQAQPELRRLAGLDT